MNASRHQLGEQQVGLRAQLDSLAGDLWHLSALTHATSDTVDESRRGTRTAVRRLGSIRARIRVVFLMHNATAWGSIAELIDLMHHDAKLGPVVVSIPHHYSGVGPARAEGRTHRFSCTQPVFLIYDSRRIDSTRPASFSGHWTRISSCVRASGTTRSRADSLLGGRQFRAVGHPKLDHVRSTEANWPIESTGTPARRVVWSAHHSILTGWNDFGMFPRARQDMLEWAKADPSTEFVFTHHPLLPGTIERETSPISPAEYDAWLSEWKGLPNTAVWRGNYAAVLAAADYLVTDGPSMMIEGQILSVPTIFLERADHIPFNDIGREIARGVHRVDSVHGARQAIVAIVEAGADPLAADQARNVARFFVEPGAAARILEVIRSEVDADRIVLSSIR